MDRDTKEDQKQIDHKLVDVAYGATSGAAIGVGIGVAASFIASAGAASIIPIVGAVAGGGWWIVCSGYNDEKSR